jgi:hypothetical protein
MPFVMKFGLDAPVKNGEQVLEQFAAAHEYRKRRVEVENWKRQLIREAEKPYGIAELNGRILAICADVKAGKMSAEDAKPKKAELYEEIERLRETPALLERMVEIKGKKHPPTPKG